MENGGHGNKTEKRCRRHRFHPHSEPVKGFSRGGTDQAGLARVFANHRKRGVCGDRWQERHREEHSSQPDQRD